MVFAFVDSDTSFSQMYKGTKWNLLFSRISKVAFIYGMLGATILLGMLFVVGSIALLAEGNIEFAIGSAALAYTLLYGSYAFIKKKRVLEKYSPYIFH